MATIIEKKERHLIPNWRDFSTTIMLGELDSPFINPIVKPNLSIDDYIADFRENEAIPFAADLISASIVNGFIDDEDVKKAARFILSKQNQATQSQSDLSKKILSSNENSIEPSINNNIAIKELENHLSEQKFEIQKHRLKIQQLKKYVIDFQYDPIAWVELSRYYTILGQKKQAIESMKISVQLAPENRFVLRSAVRLFFHYDEFDLAHDILRKKNVTNFDPWLMSAEIAVASRREKNSRFIKRGIELINSKNLSPFSITELASSIGTIELLSGNRKKSKKMFSKSLLAPNDNSLAQIEWILENKDKFLIDRNQINIQPKYNFEAESYSSFYNKKLEDALNNTYKWFLDMPFSRQPVLIGSNIADILDKRNLSIEFLELGLAVHLNDAQMLNNIAYYLALENKTKDALSYLEKARTQGTDKTETTKICIIATQGLISFRENKYEKGRKEYLEAIEETRLKKNESLNHIAILNYAREEILAKTDKVESIMQDVNKISESDDTNNISIMKLKSKVLKLYEEYKGKNNY